MRQHERYRFREGYTPLSAQELNDRFFALDGRLHQLELLNISWQQAVAEIQNHGLERINGVIQPLLDQANDILGLIQQEFDFVKTEWDQTSDTIAQEWHGILDGWAGVRGELDAMQADIDGSQDEAKSYTDAQTIFTKRLLCSWFAPSPDSHPYLPENQSVQGQDVVNLLAASEAWAGLRFDQTDANANQHLELHYWMATSDTQPINFGLAMAKGRGPLVDTPWEPSHTYTIGDKIIPTMPNGCEYEMVEGSAGYGTTDLFTGGTASASAQGTAYGGTSLASYACDDNATTHWDTSSVQALNTSPWWKYDLGSGNAITAGKLNIDWGDTAVEYRAAQVTIQGSNDDQNWDTLKIETGISQERYTDSTITWDNDNTYRYYKVILYKDNAAYVYLTELSLYELLGATGVSAGGGYGATDLCTGGTVISGGDNASYLSSRAFDDSTATDWISSQVSPNIANNAYIGYDLGSGNDIEIGKLRYLGSGEGFTSSRQPTAAVIQYSDDGTAWATASDISLGSDPTTWQEFTFTGTGAHRYWRLLATSEPRGSGDGWNWTVCEIEMFESLGGSEPTWDSTLNSTLVDNEVTWKCVRSSGGYDQVANITGRSVTASAFTPATLNFQLTGAGIPAGERVNLLAIRKVDSATSYESLVPIDTNCTITAVASNGGVAEWADYTKDKLYDGIKEFTYPGEKTALGFQSGLNASISQSYASFQFSDVKTIQRVKFWHESTIYHYPSSVLIQYSSNGTDWTSLENVSPTVGLNDVPITSPVSAAYYRVVCNAETHQWSNGYRYWFLGEVEFYQNLTNPGSGHQGDMHILDAYVQGQKV